MNHLKLISTSLVFLSTTALTFNVAANPIPDGYRTQAKQETGFQAPPSATAGQKLYTTVGPTSCRVRLATPTPPKTRVNTPKPTRLSEPMAPSANPKRVTPTRHRLKSGSNATAMTRWPAPVPRRKKVISMTYVLSIK